MLSLSEVAYGRKAYQVRDRDRALTEPIAAAAAELETAQDKLIQSIATARQADVPLRAIAAAANISHEQARRLVKRAASSPCPESTA
jgi:hypothetical protein